MSDKEVMAIEDRLRYLVRELGVACTRIQLLEIEVRELRALVTPLDPGSLPRQGAGGPVSYMGSSCMLQRHGEACDDRAAAPNPCTCDCHDYVPCPRCDGTSFKDNIRCIACNGTGDVRRTTSASEKP